VPDRGRDESAQTAYDDQYFGLRFKGLSGVMEQVG